MAKIKKPNLASINLHSMFTFLIWLIVVLIGVDAFRHFIVIFYHNMPMFILLAVVLVLWQLTKKKAVKEQK
jgi:hypothetical protein